MNLTELTSSEEDSLMKRMFPEEDYIKLEDFLEINNIDIDELVLCIILDDIHHTNKVENLISNYKIELRDKKLKKLGL